MEGVLLRATLTALVSLQLLSPLAAEEHAGLPTKIHAGLPTKIYAGCDKPSVAPEASANRARVERHRQPVVDPFTQRAFASFSLQDVEAQAEEDLQSICWARLDGVWRQEVSINFDDSAIQSEIWKVDNRKLLPLASGRYSTPRHIVIVEPKQPAQALYLSTGLTGAAFVKFVSSDGQRMEDVLNRGGPTKTYTAVNRFEYGSRLQIDVPRDGRLRLQLDGQTFYRPEPNNSLEAMEAQIPANDAFLMDKTLEYMSASRRGYDIVHQDPFFLDRNDKLEVFAEMDTQRYYIHERKVIPANFKYIPESMQGLIYRKSLVSSEQEVQETSATTLGIKLDRKPMGPKAGYSNSKSSMRSMKNGEMAGRAYAYSRTKKYALVVDYPYTRLSDSFVVAVDDARKNFRYQALIDKFGTHYPYAVTYGASAEMTQTIDRKTYAEKISQSDTNAGELGYGGLSASLSKQMGSMQGTSGMSRDEQIAFVAVGGNGSWSHDGYMAGDSHYPILLHLKPIWELLNPMYFPGEPEIYQTVRTNLQKAVNRYLDAETAELGELSGESLLADIKPEQKKVEPIEEWHVYVREAWCTGKGSGKVKSAEAKVKITATPAQGRAITTGEKSIAVDCKKKYQSTKYSYKHSDPKLLRIRGTRDEIRRFAVDFDLDWIYRGTLTGKSWQSADKHPFGTQDHPFVADLTTGKSKDYIWKVSESSKWPTLHLRLRFKKISVSKGEADAKAGRIHSTIGSGVKDVFKK